MTASLKVCGLVLFASLLSACASVYDPPPVPQNKQVATGVALGAVGGAVIGSLSSGVSIPLTTAMGGIIGGIAGTMLYKEDSLASDLARGRVQIIEIGEDMMLVLPSTYFFNKDSTHINEAFYPTLDDVAAFIRQYETETIKVAGYTDDQGSALRNLSLSRQQAQNIANYLWLQGLNARSMYSTGYGSQYPISSNKLAEGQEKNRRVQITFRRIPSDG